MSSASHTADEPVSSSHPAEQQPRQADARTIDELEDHCFGCGMGNPGGLRLSFELAVADDGLPLASTTVRLTRMHQGAPGYIHGGVIATLMDEVMSKLNRPLGVLAMTRHVEVDYLRPAPLERPLLLTGSHVRREGRKLFHAAELADERGTVLARSKALFVVVDPGALQARQTRP